VGRSFSIGMSWRRILIASIWGLRRSAVTFVGRIF
jgi:hypothetical protein